jgi:RING-box protein 1
MADVEMQDAFPSSKGKSPAAAADAMPDDTAPADAAPAAAAAPGAKPRFEVKKVRAPPPPPKLHRNYALANNTIGQWSAVALWSWDIVVENCAICRNHIMDLCSSSVVSRSATTQLAKLPASHCRHRMSSQPGQRCLRGVHRRLGNLQRWFTIPTTVAFLPRFADRLAARVPLPLHLEVAQDQTGVSVG